ncbi:MAG: sigma-70 family RNA polymerase sigma factor [Myxococcota bacterium]
MLAAEPASAHGPETSQNSEKELVLLAKAGDSRALGRIGREHVPRVRRLLLRMLGPRDDLDDLVQNVFVEFCRALPRFRSDSRLSTFIGGITVRIARRAMRRSAWFRRRGDWNADPATDGEGPERQTEASEQLRRTRRLLNKIGEKKRVAFMLWALEGLSVKEVAEMMGSSPSATQSRIYYAQKELRKLAAGDPYLKDLLQ